MPKDSRQSTSQGQPQTPLLIGRLRRGLSFEEAWRRFLAEEEGHKLKPSSAKSFRLRCRQVREL